MSGGHFEYKDLEVFNLIRDILERDGFKDKKLIKLVELVGNIIHAYDWWKCGDTDEGTFKKEYFQNTQNIKELLK